MLTILADTTGQAQGFEQSNVSMSNSYLIPVGFGVVLVVLVLWLIFRRKR
jgi:predicted RND superfamily exporter protein